MINEKEDAEKQMDSFHNDPVLSAHFPDFEKLDLQPVSRKYLKAVMFNSAIISMIIFTALVTAQMYLSQELKAAQYLTLGFSLIFITFFFIIQYLAFFQRKYAVREHDIVYHFGLIKRNIVIIPFKRIQHSSLEEGWISRMLGLKSVSFYTAGARGSDLQIDGLPKAEAERINQLVMNAIAKEEKFENNAEMNPHQNSDSAKTFSTDQ